jgi:hypothetical protein
MMFDYYIEVEREREMYRGGESNRGVYRVGRERLVFVAFVGS